MKKLILLLALLIGLQSCSQTILTGKEHVRQQQANGNYSIDKWAKQYRKLNSSKAKNKPTVTTQKSSSKKVPSPIRP
jgi:PBP1b-binding outer membrane lipoprotein LpoB